jgi:hypothetical protein
MSAVVLRIFGSSTFSHSLNPQETCAFGLFDHLVGAAEKRQRHGKPERLGSLEIDDQLDLTGKSTGFSPLRIRPVYTPSAC